MRPLVGSQATAERKWLIESRRLIDQSHDLLQAAKDVLEQCEPRYQMPVRLKRVTAQSAPQLHRRTPTL